MDTEKLARPTTEPGENERQRLINQAIMVAFFGALGGVFVYYTAQQFLGKLDVFPEDFTIWNLLVTLGAGGIAVWGILLTYRRVQAADKNAEAAIKALEHQRETLQNQITSDLADLFERGSRLIAAPEEAQRIAGIALLQKVLESGGQDYARQISAVLTWHIEQVNQPLAYAISTIENPSSDINEVRRAHRTVEKFRAPNASQFSAISVLGQSVSVDDPDRTRPRHRIKAFSFANHSFVGVNFSRLHFEAALMSSTEFVECDFNESRFVSTLTEHRVKFVCCFIHMSLLEFDVKNPLYPRFHRCSFSYSHVRNAGVVEYSKVEKTEFLLNDGRKFRGCWYEQKRPEFLRDQQPEEGELFKRTASHELVDVCGNGIEIFKPLED